MLTFCNGYHRQVWISIMWFSPNCPDGGDWTKKGWWNLMPGQCANVLDEDLDEINQFYAFFAHSDDGTEWSGPFIRTVPRTRFEWCEWTANSESRDVGFRIQDIGDNDDFTITLVQ